MIYNSGKGEFTNWIVKEETFDAERLGKCESIMSQGNGYMGVRAAMEETANPTSRFTLIAGCFDNLEGDRDQTTELANSADTTAAYFKVNGEDVVPDADSITDYERTINLKTGLLRRTYVWHGKSGAVKFEFLRIVSLKDRHLMCAKMNITPLDADVALSITTGIDGECIHRPAHFDGVSKGAEGTALHMITKTHESGILVSTSVFHKTFVNGETVTPEFSVTSDAMKEITLHLDADVKKGDTFTLEKTTTVFMNRDKELNDCDECCLSAVSAEHMAEVSALSFEKIAVDSAAEWQSRIWQNRDVKIVGSDIDQLAVRFALYHLTVMSPVHDNRMNIGAKGLSGPGYKGHTFWDTEIFMLPYFIFSAPAEARSLLEHRYNSMPAAKKNAEGRGFAGAMYPWESAWITDGEATPTWCLTGLMEYHITADVAFAVYYYYMITGDSDFMDKCGYEMIFETAAFWDSRLEWIDENDRYEIRHVIGPDEYKEDVDNNAYTNYMAHLNMGFAVKYAAEIKANKPDVYEALSKKLDIDAIAARCEEKMAKLYLPRENEDGLIPEDDTYLSLIDLSCEECSVSEYEGERRNNIFNTGLFKVMVSKQADVMALCYLMEDLFTAEVKKKNFYFYEKRCLHDSSLSLSTYSALAADLGEREVAYKLYQRASMIDLGPVMWSSDPGIHAASLGGIWQCSVLGFGGIRLYGENLRIQPNLPDSWKCLSFKLHIKGEELLLKVTHDNVTIKNLTATADVTVLIGGKLVTVKADEVTVLNFDGTVAGKVADLTVSDEEGNDLWK